MPLVIDSLKPAPLRSRWREYLERPGLPEVLLSILTVCVYARSLTLGFVYDDHGLFDNPFILSWKNVLKAFNEDTSLEHASNFYRPLTALWQGLVYKLAATSPIGWHLSAILLYTLCVVLVFRLSVSLLNNRGLAMLAAAVFALHPAHVEAVTWVSDSADPLLTALVLFSALAFLRWLRSGSPVWWATSWLLAAACCFVKETGVLMPALLLVLALCVESTVSEPAILMTGFSFLLSSCGFLVLRSHILHGFSHPLSTAGNREMVLTLPAALWFYFSHLVFPVSLGPCYPLAFVSNWRSEAFVLPLLLLTAILAVTGWLFRRMSERRLFWFCAVWMLVPLAAPLYLKLFPDFELVHDRYLFIPTIAFGVALAAAVRALSSKAPERRANYSLAIATAVLLMASAAETIYCQGVWQSDTSLFQRAVDLTPRNARALVNLGVTKLQKGDYPEGISLLKRALEIQPNNAFALFDLGNAAWESNDAATAEIYVQRAVALEAHPNWWVVLACAKMKLGKPTEAEWAARRALAIDPGVPKAHMLLGAVQLGQGDSLSAVREFSAELQLNPQDSSAQQAFQLAQEQLAKQHH